MVDPNEENKKAEIEKITSSMKVDETLDNKEDPQNPAKKDEEQGKDKPVDEIKSDEKKVDPEKPIVNYKEKFRASASEAQRLLVIGKEQHKIIESFISEDQLSDDEMRTIYKDFDDMTENEQSRWKEFQMEKKRTNRIALEKRKYELTGARNQAIDLLVNSNELLLKNKDQFLEFVTKPENELVDAVTLGKSFLFDLVDEDPKLPSEEVKKPILEMERGSASKGVKPEGLKEVVKEEDLTDDQLETLMVTNNRKYMEIIQRRAKKLAK